MKSYPQPRAAQRERAGGALDAMRRLASSIAARLGGGHRCETCGEVAGRNETCAACADYRVELKSW